MERLQKILSAAGLLSRRAAEEAIRAGRVTVNGRTAQLGESAEPDRDDVRLDGKPVRVNAQKTVIMLNKPRGVVTTMSDEKGRRSVADLTADLGVRVYPVGRLDLDSEGLLLMTDDGELANRLTHPSLEVEKTYTVWVRGELENAAEKLGRAVVIDGKPIAKPQAELLWLRDEEACLSVTIHEGRNRQIRKMCALAGLRVTRLRRVSEGPIRLGDLPTGKWRRLTEPELRSLERKEAT